MLPYMSVVSYTNFTLGIDFFVSTPVLEKTNQVRYAIPLRSISNIEKITISEHVYIVFNSKEINPLEMAVSMESTCNIGEYHATNY